MNSVDVTGTQAELYELKGALESVVKGARVKFDESVDMDIVLGIDPNKGEQTVRGSALLPHGTGKKVRVIAFARGEHEEAAKAAGADFVGAEDLIAKIEGGWMDFDAAVATPDLMGMVGKVARALGPRGLLPNNRLGTVTFDLASVIKEIKQGRVSFRNDKGGNVHAPCGRVSFGADKLVENCLAVVKAVQASKPATAKGRYIKRITVSSTMGQGFGVSLDGLGTL
jgi:large subunit ribosomal protein L1